MIRQISTEQIHGCRIYQEEINDDERKNNLEENCKHPSPPSQKDFKKK